MVCAWDAVVSIRRIGHGEEETRRTDRLKYEGVSRVLVNKLEYEGISKALVNCIIEHVIIRVP